jgi:hypothetical protein
MIKTMKGKKNPHSELTRAVLSCCFEVMYRFYRYIVVDYPYYVKFFYPLGESD